MIWRFPCMNRLLSDLSMAQRRHCNAYVMGSATRRTASTHSAGTHWPSSRSGKCETPSASRANSRKLPNAGPSLNIGLWRSGRAKQRMILSPEKLNEYGHLGGGEESCSGLGLLV